MRMSAPDKYFCHHRQGQAYAGATPIMVKGDVIGHTKRYRGNERRAPFRSARRLRVMSARFQRACSIRERRAGYLPISMK